MTRRLSRNALERATRASLRLWNRVSPGRTWGRATGSWNRCQTAAAIQDTVELRPSARAGGGNRTNTGRLYRGSLFTAAALLRRWIWANLDRAIRRCALMPPPAVRIQEGYIGICCFDEQPGRCAVNRSPSLLRRFLLRTGTPQTYCFRDFLPPSVTLSFGLRLILMCCYGTVIRQAVCGTTHAADQGAVHCVLTPQSLRRTHSGAPPVHRHCAMTIRYR